MMKNVFYLVAFIALAACSSSKSNKRVICNSGKDRVDKANVDNDSYLSSASAKERSHRLTFSSDITDADMRALGELAKEFRNTGVGKITIIPVVYSSSQASVIVRVCSKIREVFLKYGIRESILDIRPYEVSGDMVKNCVVIKSYIYEVLLPRVSKWKYNVGDIDTTKKLPNFGTAMSYNLGCMIANPRDLVDPEGYGKVDGKSAVISVRKVVPISSGMGSTGLSSGTGVTSVSSSSSSVSR